MKFSADPIAELPFDDKTKEQMRLINRKNIFNPTQLNEAGSMYSNFKSAESLTFPKNLPLIFFIQANQPATDRWIPEHEKQVKDSVHGKVLTFEEGHYLYRTKAKGIVENFRVFMEEAK